MMIPRRTIDLDTFFRKQGPPRDAEHCDRALEEPRPEAGWVECAAGQPLCGDGGRSRGEHAASKKFLQGMYLPPFEEAKCSQPNLKSRAILAELLNSGRNDRGKRERERKNAGMLGIMMDGAVAVEYR